MQLFSKRYVAQYPRGVATLFCTFALLMVSSASFLGVFVLYLTQALHFSDARAYSLFSSFLSLLAILAVAGGYLGGRLLSHRSAVWVGYLLIFLGLLLLGFDGKHIIYFSLSCYALGASLVMPNGMYLLGQLYKPGDSRKNSGFTLIYTGLNVGALLGFLVSSYLAHDISYSFCFKIAALAPLAAILILSLNFSQFQRDQKFTLGNYVIFGCVLVALLLLIFVLLDFNQFARFIIVAFALAVFMSLVFFAIKLRYVRKTLSKRLLYFSFLFVAAVVFWSFYRLEPNMLILFFKRNVDRIIFHKELPPGLILGLNPVFMIILGVFFSWLWLFLAKKEIQFSFFARFLLGLIFVSVSFIVLWSGVKMANAQGLISLSWVVVYFFWISLAEVVLVPASYTIISELVETKWQSTALGIVRLINGAGSVLAGFLALAAVTNNHIKLRPLMTNAIYARDFFWFAIAVLVLAVVMLFGYRSLKNLW